MTHKWQDLHDKDNVVFLTRYERDQGYRLGCKRGFWFAVALTASLSIPTAFAMGLLMADIIKF